MSKRRQVWACAALQVGALSLNAVNGATAARASESREVAPTSLPDAVTYVYREVAPEPLRLHVFRPPGWKPADRRAGFVVFFGGDWKHGTPLQVASWTRWAAASLGMVGVAPDYRTAARHGTSPFESVDDARACLRWLQEHAAELGIDPRRIVVGGDSAGGLLALWTAIAHDPPRAEKRSAPHFKPAAIILTSAVSDTSQATGYTPERFGPPPEAMSPVHQLDAAMPPVLIFHGDADRIVPHIESVRLRDALRQSGNRCELVTVRGGTHNFGAEMPEWRDRIRTRIAEFLRERKLL